MQDRQKSGVSPSLIAGFSVLILAAGSATALLTWNSVRNPASAPAPTTVQPQQFSSPSKASVDSSAAKTSNAVKPAPSVTATEKTIQIYWLKSDGNKIALAPTSVNLKSGKSDAVLTAALEKLLEGPRDTTVSSTVPVGTRLRSVVVKSDGVHVDLSKEFTSGGGSTSMTGRVAQILYTASSLEPHAKIWLSVEGQPLEVLGGEGLLLDQPFTRQAFEQDFAL